MNVEERNVADVVPIKLDAEAVRSVVERVWKGRVACGGGMRQSLK